MTPKERELEKSRYSDRMFANIRTLLDAVDKPGVTRAMIWAAISQLMEWHHKNDDFVSVKRGVIRVGNHREWREIRRSKSSLLSATCVFRED